MSQKSKFNFHFVESPTFYTHLSYLPQYGFGQPIDGPILPWSNESDDSIEIELPGN